LPGLRQLAEQLVERCSLTRPLETFVAKQEASAGALVLQLSSVAASRDNAATTLLNDHG